MLNRLVVCRTGYQDIALNSSTISIAAGATSGTVSFTLQRDSIAEPTETLQVEIALPANPPLGLVLVDGSGTLTITNDDFVTFSASAIPTITEGDTGSQQVQLNINASAPSSSSVSVQYATVAGTATVGLDYVSSTGTVTFAPGEVSKSITLTIVSDTLAESTESFTLSLSNPVGGTVSGTGNYSITITDDDKRTVSFDSPSVTEGNSGSKLMTFTASIPTSTGSNISFSWATSAAGTATAGVDFTAASGTATIEAGQTTTSFSISIEGGSTYELDETVGISISSMVNSTNTSATATGTITNDDLAPAVVLADTIVTRGQGAQFKAWFKISISGGTTQNATVNYSTSNGTALQGKDYTTTSGTATFVAGQATSQWIGVPILAGTGGNATLKFNLNLTNPVHARVTDNLAVGSIVHMAVTTFTPLGNHLFAIKFPSGFGQNYLIQSTSSVSQGWTPISSILVGSGSPITQVLYCEDPQCFFRVVATEGTPPSN